jgi:hypothetical protein
MKNTNNDIWDEITKLKEKIIVTLTNNKINRIIEVNDNYLSRLSSNNKTSKISKSEVLNIIDFIKKEKNANRIQILNANHMRRNSSIIIAILATIDSHFTYDKFQKTISLK